MPDPVTDRPPPLAARIILVRHGATEWSAIGRHTGRTDIPLSELGRREASALGPIVRRLAGTDALVFTSPLRRAMDTAAVVMPDVEPQVVDALAEFDYGNYEGLTNEEISEQVPNWNLFTDGCPGGESVRQAGARCDAFAAKLERMAVDRTVVAFTHGHLSRILTARLLELPSETGIAFYNDTATVSVLTARRGRYVLTGWNRAAD